MNLEQIDTSTTAGKAEVMRLAAEGRRVACREEDISPEWFAVNESDWDWRTYDYAIIAEPVGPEEVWVTAGRGIASGVWNEESAAIRYSEKHGLSTIRYIRADLAGEVK